MKNTIPQPQMNNSKSAPDLNLKTCLKVLHFRCARKMFVLKCVVFYYSIILDLVDSKAKIKYGV